MKKERWISALTAAGLLVTAIPNYQIHAEENENTEKTVWTVKEGETKEFTFTEADDIYSVSVPEEAKEYIAAEYNGDTYTVALTGISVCDETVLIVLSSPDTGAAERTIKVKVEAAEEQEAAAEEKAEDVTTEEVVIDNEAEEEKAAAPEEELITADGFVNKDGKIYYYKDSAALKGVQTINGKIYYFDAEGIMQTGLQFVNNKSYFFNEDAEPEKCFAVTGEWKTVDGNKYYFKTNGQAEVGFKEVGSDLYHLNRPKGEVLTGLQVIDGRTYFFDKDGKAFKGGWKTVDGKRFFFKTNGAAEKGWKQISGKWYFMDRTTAVMQTGLQFVDNKSYFFNTSTGEAFTGGWKQVNGTWYFFKKNSGAAEIGWRQEGSTWYYLNKPKGNMAVGWKQVDNKWYYFKSSGKMAANGWIQDKGKWYYLNKNGTMKSDCWFTENGNKYYLAKSGAMVTGWLKRPDAWYYFKDNGKMYKNGTMTIDGKNQRFAIDGQWIDNSFINSEARPFRIYVNRARCTMTIYLKDYQGNYVIPYKAILISVGMPDTPTPTGWSEIGQKYSWYWYKEDTCWLRYVSFFAGSSKMLHSEAYYSQNYDDMVLGEFNKLGNPASHGCVRMALIDAKWVYENCYAGTRVYVYDDWDYAGPLGKPSPIRVDASSGTGWDPTDPDPGNPWNW